MSVTSSPRSTKPHLRALPLMDYYARTTQVPNELVDQWMRDLTLSELKLLLLVIRMTRGWVVGPNGRRKTRDWLSCSRIMTMTGLSDRSITMATSSLVSRGLLVVSNAKGRTLSEPLDRRGCTKLYYGLAADDPATSRATRIGSETVSVHDPKAFRITKPTHTKPNHRSGWQKPSPVRKRYFGTLGHLLLDVVPASLRERLEQETEALVDREKSP